MQVAAKERRWAALAKREGRDNLREARRFRTMHEGILARESFHEAKVDFQWANKRLKIARINERAAKKR